jgi:hypothetical protein
MTWVVDVVCKHARSCPTRFFLRCLDCGATYWHSMWWRILMSLWRRV